MSDQGFNPLVSIVIPVYNGSDYLREAIDSALAQTYDNTEIIVVNDGSRDDGATERIAKEYGGKIRYFAKENGGVSTALNTGIRNMRGQYFSWLSHDDVYMPDKVEKQIKALRDAPEDISVVYCGYVNIDKDSKMIAPSKRINREEAGVASWKKMLFDLFGTGSFNGCCMLIEKTVFDKVGLFDEDLRFYQDGVMWFRIFSAGYDALCTSDIGVKGRIHNKQLTYTGQSMFRADCEKISTFMIPILARISTKTDNILLAYIKYNAKYYNTAIVKNACAAAKENDLLRFKDRVSVFVLRCYGIVRPAIRKVYYAVFKGLNKN